GEKGQALELPALPWRDKVISILRDYSDRTPGSLVEEKPVGLAWHYRAGGTEYGAVQANELRLHLNELLSNTPVEILPGEKVIEVRSTGANKGRIVPAILARHPEAKLLAIGDAREDEYLFAALPRGAAAVHVGPPDSVSQAELRVPGVKQVRALLTSLLA